MIKNNLTALGKENLFFRWIEIVQSETSQTGSFTGERYVGFQYMLSEGIGPISLTSQSSCSCIWPKEEKLTRKSLQAEEGDTEDQRRI